MSKYSKILQSSNGSGNLSLTFRGFLIGLVPVIIYLFETRGIMLTNIEIISYIDRVAFVLSEVVIFIGLARKVYYILKK